MNGKELVDTTTKRVRSGLKWTALVRLLAQLINWGISIVVIRYVSPIDFGLKSMAELTVALLAMLTSGGVQSTIVYSKELTNDAFRKIFGLTILINLILFFIQCLSAYPLAEFYNEPRIVLVAQAMAVGFLISPFVSIPTALLSREMDFKAQSSILFVSSTLGGISVFIMAINGFGVWALIFGPQISAILNAIMLNVYNPCLCWPKFSLRGIVDLAGYGGIITLASVMWMVYSKMDIFIAGRYLTTHEVGLYAVAVHLASLPIDKIMPILNQVAFPAFSKLRDDKILISRYFIKAVRLTSFVLFPMSFGLAGVADYFVPLVFGDEWNESVNVLKVLCLVFPVRAIVSLCSSISNAMGYPRIGLQYSILATIVMAPAFLYGLHLDSLGLGLAWLFVFPWVMLVNVLVTLKIINLSFFEYSKAMFPPFFVSLLMLFGLLCFTRIDIIIINLWVTLCIMVLMGGAIYLGGMFVVSRNRVLELLNMTK